MENDNKRLFEWLNPDGCWHETEIDAEATAEYGHGDLYRCKKCNARHWPRNMRPEMIRIDYSAEYGFFALLSGLRARGFAISFNSLNYTVWKESESVKHNGANWGCFIDMPDNIIGKWTAYGGTLTEAAYLAAIKALESEGTE